MMLLQQADVHIINYAQCRYNRAILLCSLYTKYITSTGAWRNSVCPYGVAEIFDFDDYVQLISDTATQNIVFYMCSVKLFSCQH